MRKWKGKSTFVTSKNVCHWTFLDSTPFAWDLTFILVNDKPRVRGSLFSRYYWSSTAPIPQHTWWTSEWCWSSVSKGRLRPMVTWQQWLLQAYHWANVCCVWGCLRLGKEGKGCSRVSLYCCKSLICRPNETWELPRIPGGPCPLRAFTLSEQRIYLVSGNLTTNQILPEVYIWVQSPFHFWPIYGIWFIVLFKKLYF